MDFTADNDSCAKTASSQRMQHILPYDWWRSIGSPQHIVAPMVEHSDLAYRMMTRKYGAQLVYTQMYNAYAFVHSQEMRELHFTTCSEDRPLIVQIAGHDPKMLLQAARFVEEHCDAVDLNLGCPQGIAKRGRYGAFLMDDLELLQEIVSTLATGLKIPVTCKIRIHRDFERTIKYCETLVNAGASMLTVHGRTRDEKGHLVRAADWEMIRRIKEHFANRDLPIPIVANGGIETYADVLRCLDVTKCDGVMSSEAILENPAFFSRNSLVCKSSYQEILDETNPDEHEPVLNLKQIKLTEEFLHFCRQYPVWPFRGVRSHINKMLFRFVNVGCSATKVADTNPENESIGMELRIMISNSYSIEDFERLCQRCMVLLTAGAFEGKSACTWYRRYRQHSRGDGHEEAMVTHPREREQIINLSTSFLSDESDLWAADNSGDTTVDSVFDTLFLST